MSRYTVVHIDHDGISHAEPAFNLLTARERCDALLAEDYSAWIEDAAEEREANTEIAELTQELMQAERLPVRSAREWAEREYERLLLYATFWDEAAFDQGNPDALEGAIPF